jgi:hypothetical protein
MPSFNQRSHGSAINERMVVRAHTSKCPLHGEGRCTAHVLPIDLTRRRGANGHMLRHLADRLGQALASLDGWNGLRVAHACQIESRDI